MTTNLEGITAARPLSDLVSSRAAEVVAAPLPLGYRAAKRLLDVVVSGILLLLLLPMFLLIALAIKLNCHRVRPHLRS